MRNDDTLLATIRDLTRPGKGILAADESQPASDQERIGGAEQRESDQDGSADAGDREKRCKHCARLALSAAQMALTEMFRSDFLTAVVLGEIRRSAFMSGVWRNWGVIHRVQCRSDRDRSTERGLMDG